MDASHTRSAAATRLGKYRMLTELGRGGMARVGLAVTEGPGGFSKLLVVKQMSTTFEEEPEFVTMFLDEARLAARLRHPNVVQTYEVGEADGHHFMVMEYLDGQPLSRIRTRLGRAAALPLAVHLRALVDALAGLHYAHELVDYEGTPLGVVHRDVSPDNIFVTYDGAVKVVDFGIAKAKDSTNETQAGAIKGKVSYMAPEHAMGHRLDRRADVFAMGVILWEASTGTRMWKGLPHSAILRELVLGRIPDARQANPAIPDALAAILQKATAPALADRYATAAELAADLEAFLDDAGDRSSARDLGRLAAACFEAERAEIKAVVHEQLHAVVSPEPPPAPAAAADRPTPAPEPSRTAPAPDAPRASASAPVLSVPTRARASRSVALGAVALALVLAVGTAARAAKGHAPAAAAPAAIAAGAGGPALQAPREPAVARLRVSASPPEATLFLDDLPLPSNPWSGELPPGADEHRIRAEAPGHATQAQQFSLTRDRVIEVALPPLPAAARPDPAAMAATRAGGKRPARHIDTTNPYAR